MQPRNPQREAQLPPVRQDHPCARAGVVQLGIRDAHVRVAREPHAPHWPGHARRDAARAGVVRSRDHAPRAARELHERVLECLHGAVALEVVGLDVVHDRHRRRERQERAVELVRLDHEQLTPTQPRVPTPRSDTAAGESRRIPPGGRQRLRDHRRRGRLAVGSGNSHHGPAGDSLAERIGPPHHGDP